MRPKHYSRAKNLLNPKSPVNVGQEELTKVVKENFITKHNVTYERFLFYKRTTKHQTKNKKERESNL